MSFTYKTTRKDASPHEDGGVLATAFASKVQELWRLATHRPRLRTKAVAGALVLSVFFGLTPGCGDDGSGGGGNPDASITDPECGD